MKIFVYVLLWGVVWAIATAISVFLGDFLDGLEIVRVIRSLIVAIPTGMCVGIGFIIQSKLEIYFKRKHTYKTNNE